MSQDVHQTDYRLNPLLLNPAHTGAFYGTARIGVVYRDQFRPFIDKAFQTPSLFIDMPLIYGFKETHWVGVGVSLYSDEAGDIGYKTTGTNLSLAYHIGLDQDLNQVFTIGAQYGQVSKSISRGSEAIFADEIRDPSIASPDQTFVEGFETSYSDIGLGLSFKSKMGKRTQLQIGVGASHVAIPNKAKGLVNFRLNGSASLQYDVSKRTQIEPMLYYYQEKTTTVFMPQFHTSYQLNPEKDIRLKAGLGYRSGDAMQFMLGTSFRDWTVGLSYDLTMSAAAAATENFGGFEIGINKIIKIYKEPEVDPVILCPRF